jgi:hypothetical protein
VETTLVVLRRRPCDRLVEAGVGAVFRAVHRSDRGIREAGADEARLDDGDLDAEASDLEAQGVAQRLDGVLGRVVVAGAGQRQLPAHGGEGDDPAVLLSPHPRQHELAHLHQPEDVGLELGADLLHRHGLDGPGLAEARVVDEHADGPFALLDLFDGPTHRVFVGHVEGQEHAAMSFERGYLLDVAGRGVDLPAHVGEAFGGGIPYA